MIIIILMIISHPAGSSVSVTRVGKTWVGWEAGCSLILIALESKLGRWNDGKGENVENLHIFGAGCVVTF